MILILVCLPTPTLSQEVVSTFETGLEGWLIVGDNAGAWLGSGGNPGGCMAINDLAAGPINRASAPPKFLGDWSGLSAADTVSFDVYFANAASAVLAGEWIFRIAGPGGAATGLVLGIAPPADEWSRYAIAIDPGDWSMESGTWAELLANVTSFKILVEFVTGNEDVQIDNVRIANAPPPVFEPCVYSDFNGTGTDDWSFEGTGARSNPPNNNGNGGGFLQIVDNTSLPGFALPPSRFLGDWSPLNDNGFVAVDLRVLSHAGTREGSTEFIRISGPGGSAYVALDSLDIPTSDREWRTLTFPLNAATWTVDTGSWPGLLDFVSELRVDTDFFSGSETICFDNFGRLRGDCPPIDYPVTIYTGMTPCAVLSFIGVSDVAFNPHDQTLYGMLRELGANYDGVYRLIGDDSYTRLQTYDRPSSLIFDDDGDGFVSENFSGNIYRFIGPDSSMLWVSGFHSGDDDPYGMTFAPTGFNGPNVSAGDIIVVDHGNSGADQIWSFSPDTPENELLLTPDPGNVDWYDITAAPDGSVWVCDALTDDSLFVLSPSGALSGFALSTPIGGPVSIVADPGDSTLYVASSTDQAIYGVDPTTGAVTLVADGFTELAIAGMEIGYLSNRLWVPDTGMNRIYEFCLPVATGIGDGSAPPRRFAVQAYPNPFNPSVYLSFQLERAGDVRLQIYDVAGRRVRTFVAKPMTAGAHTLHWDGRDDAGREAASGVYFARLQNGLATAVTRMVLVR